MAVTGLESLGTYRAAIDTEMQQFFGQVPQLLGVELSAYGSGALANLELFCLRPGKRIRGSLAALAYDAAAGTDHAAEGIQLGVVLELMQGYLLIIDDVMDRSMLRRGEATVHEQYKAAGDMGEHEANMIAVNIGLLAQHLSSLLVTNLAVPPEARVQTMSLLQRNIAITGLGQLDDVSTHTSSQLSQTDIIRKYTEKTSYYTFVNPLQLGFALAGSGETTTLDACETFGVAAGIAFQIHDDYLGIYGKTGDSGKSNLDDLREGKRTLLVQYALEHASDDDVAELCAVLGKDDASETDLTIAQVIFQRTGAVDYAAEQAKSYAAAAKQTLAVQSIGTPELRQLLAELMDYAITRTH